MRKSKPKEETEWKPIMGYETRYVINRNGKIKSISREVNRRDDSKHIIPEMIKKQRVTKFGYATCLLSINKKYKHHFVHVLVALHFIGPKPSDRHQVNHKDCNKLNNKVDNLEWVTRSENLKHAYRNGLMCQKGEHHATVKLDNKKVLHIYNSKLGAKHISKMYNVCEATIYNIRSGVSWGHITKHIKNDSKSSASNGIT